MVVWNRGLLVLATGALLMACGESDESSTSDAATAPDAATDALVASDVVITSDADGSASSQDGAGGATGARQGRCLLLSNGAPTSCHVYCGAADGVLSAAKTACAANNDEWSDDPSSCPNGRLGVCMANAIMCEQYCYQDDDLTAAESIEGCQELCSNGTFTTY
jgi:hypothetical protein